MDAAHFEYVRVHDLVNEPCEVNRAGDVRLLPEHPAMTAPPRRGYSPSYERGKALMRIKSHIEFRRRQYGEEWFAVVAEGSSVYHWRRTQAALKRQQEAYLLSLNLMEAAVFQAEKLGRAPREHVKAVAARRAFDDLVRKGEHVGKSAGQVWRDLGRTVSRQTVQRWLSDASRRAA